MNPIQFDDLLRAARRTLDALQSMAIHPSHYEQLQAAVGAALCNPSSSDAEIISQASDMYASENLEIDTCAAVSHADDGAWVSAWVWVQGEEIADDETRAYGPGGRP